MRENTVLLISADSSPRSMLVMVGMLEQKKMLKTTQLTTEEHHHPIMPTHTTKGPPMPMGVVMRGDAEGGPGGGRPWAATPSQTQLLWNTRLHSDALSLRGNLFLFLRMKAICHTLTKTEHDSDFGAIRVEVFVFLYNRLVLLTLKFTTKDS